jgi:hypothetical protein
MLVDVIDGSGLYHDNLSPTSQVNPSTVRPPLRFLT